MAKEQPSFRGEVKTSLITEATRSGGRPEAALALTQLLKVNGSKEWYQEVSESYERLNPESDFESVCDIPKRYHKRSRIVIVTPIRRDFRSEKSYLSRPIELLPKKHLLPLIGTLSMPQKPAKSSV